MVIKYAGIEWTGPSHSAFLTTMILLSYPVGLMLLPGIAYLISNWRTQQLVYFSPLIPLVGMYYWSASSGFCKTSLDKNVMKVTDCGSVFPSRLLPESARWLMTQGKKEEVQKELLRAARVNKRKIPQNLLDKVCSHSKQFRRSSYRKKKRQSLAYTVFHILIYFSSFVLFSWKSKLQARKRAC